MPPKSIGRPVPSKHRRTSSNSLPRSISSPPRGSLGDDSREQNLEPGLFHDIAIDPKVKNRSKTVCIAAVLSLCLVSFTIQTESAAYVQRSLGWNKSYSMLWINRYVTHSSWILLWPVQLLVLRMRKWRISTRKFMQLHLQSLRMIAKSIEHRSLAIGTQKMQLSPVPYLIRTTALISMLLTIAGSTWYLALRLTTASDLTAIYNCSAFTTYIFSYFLLGERFRLEMMAAVGTATIGVFVIAYGGQSSKDDTTPKSDQGDLHGQLPHRFAGNVIIAVGSVLYGLYEAVYKYRACPPEGSKLEDTVIFANTFGSMIGAFTLLVLWIPIPILHLLGLETFELPSRLAVRYLLLSMLTNMVFSGSFLVLISLTSPVFSSVAALLTLFTILAVEQVLPPPLHQQATGASLVGGGLILVAFLILVHFTITNSEDRPVKRAEGYYQQIPAMD